MNTTIFTLLVLICFLSVLAPVVSNDELQEDGNSKRERLYESILQEDEDIEEVCMCHRLICYNINYLLNIHEHLHYTTEIHTDAI